MVELDGDHWSAVAQDQYEKKVIEEARRIVDGDESLSPTVEYLRVLLSWLDGVSQSTIKSQNTPF